MMCPSPVAASTIAKKQKISDDKRITKKNATQSDKLINVRLCYEKRREQHAKIKRIRYPLVDGMAYRHTHTHTHGTHAAAFMRLRMAARLESKRTNIQIQDEMMIPHDEGGQCQ